MKRVFALSLMFVICLSGFSLSQDWSTVTVDSDGDVGKYTSIVVDDNDCYHIAYFDSDNYNLKYAMWDGSSWQIDPVDTSERVGQCTSIAIDDDYYPHISYSDIGDDDLKYAKWNGSSWEIESVDTTDRVGKYSSLALDSNGYPHISYLDYSSHDLKYARWDGSGWQIESVDTTGLIGRYTSIVLDGDDYPHISYRDMSNDILKYARWDGSSWQIEEVDTSPGSGMYTSIVLDGDGNPHISYNEGINNDLKYANWDGSVWQIETVDSDGDVGKYTSLVLDGNGYPHIAYFDSSEFKLKYTEWNGSSWQIEVVDKSGQVGKYVSLDLDGDDSPHISYYDHDNGELKHAFFNTAPSEFNLLSPEHNSYTSDTPTLDWEDSDDGGEDTITYDLWYAIQEDFDPHWEFNDLTESTFTFTDGYLVEGATYYWKVVASDGYEETWCTAPGGGGDDEYWAFNIIFSDINLTTFSAVDKGGEAIVLNWSAEATEEEHIEGFNLYRREMGLQEITPFSGSEDTHPRFDTHLDEGWTQINSSLITGENPYSYIDDAVESGNTYEYQLEAVVEEEPTTLGTTQGMCGLPTSFAITSIHPNPATDEVKITLSTPETTDVNIEVYDIVGRLMNKISIGEVETGEHTEVLSTSDLSSGVYTVKASAGDEQSTEKMVVVR